MTFRLISHVNRDDDLIEAWLKHYLTLGVESFHLIAHGGREENGTLFQLVSRYPIAIIDTYSGVFDPFEKRDRLVWGLAKLGGGWIVLVDSDEFVEFPYGTLATTVKVMQWLRADSVSAPMLQRFASDGFVHVDGGSRPFEAYPWCSTDLYERLGQPQAVIDKYPLFQLQRRTWLRSGGNHYPPNGCGSRLAPMLAVTHHFKWRPSVHDRMVRRAESTHAYRGESAQYLRYLSHSEWRLPTEGAFRYSRRALFARGLLRRPSPVDFALRRSKVVESSNGRGSVFDIVMSPEHLASILSRRGYTATALCGAGSGGRMFMNALREKNVNVTCVVDRDPSRWGSTFEGIRICALDQALESGERTFVAASLVYGAEMKAQVEQRASELGLGVTVFATLRPRGVS
jgi:hypothetical protein